MRAHHIALLNVRALIQQQPHARHMTWGNLWWRCCLKGALKTFMVVDPPNVHDASGWAGLLTTTSSQHQRGVPTMVGLIESAAFHNVLS
jgi:hypothetical protein